MGWLEAIARTVTGLGYDLVDTERAPRGLLRVTIDRLPGDPAGEFITVEDCEKVTRQLQHVLEVEGGAYERLEVSSPGLDRLLRTPAHFSRFVGEKVDLTLKMPFQGRKRYTGVLQSRAVNGAAGVDGGQAATPLPVGGDQLAAWRIVFDDEKGEHALDFGLEEVREARLVPVVDFKGRRFAPPAEAPTIDAGGDEGLAMELRDK